MSSPTTPGEWWVLLEQNKGNLENLVQNYHPNGYNPNPISMRITAGGAEAACDIIRNEIKKKEWFHPRERFNSAFEKRDHNEMLSVLNEAWFGVPESTDCWRIPSFGVLCDLCSESWVFEESADDGDEKR